MRKMRRFMKKKDFGRRFQHKKKDWKPTKQSPAKPSQFQKNNNDERDDLCYNCRQPGHSRDECPNPLARRYHDDDRQQRRDKREKARAFTAESEKGKEKADADGTDESEISSSDSDSSYQTMMH